jgi:hypothetical protein
MVFTFHCYRDPKTFWSYDIIHIRFPKYSYGHRISSVILLSIRKKLCSLSFIIIMTDIQNFCDRNSVTHNKNDWPIDIHVKNSNVGLEIQTDHKNRPSLHPSYPISDFNERYIKPKGSNSTTNWIQNAALSNPTLQGRGVNSTFLNGNVRLASKTAF